MYYSFAIIDVKVPGCDWTEYTFILMDNMVYLDHLLHYSRKSKKHVERIKEGWHRIPNPTPKYDLLESPDVPSNVILEARKHLANLPFVIA